tara:strand:- start:992 stop:1495 length:504 start_codon:yes stop_codon:yes gene_type:complete
MLKRFSILILALSFVLAGPSGPAKKNSGHKTLPGGKGKQEKPFNKKGKKGQLTYKEVALQLTDSKNLSSNLSDKEAEAVSALIAGTRKGGTFTAHLTKAMKKHKCYKGKDGIKKRKQKFSKWPSANDNVKWFELVCSQDKDSKKGSGNSTNSLKPRESSRRGQNQSN